VHTCTTPQIQNVSNACNRRSPFRGNPIQFHASPSARMAAHLGSGRGVPDHHEVVKRPADDAIAVRGEIDGLHPVRVTHQRAHLPPTHLYLRGWSWIMSGFYVMSLIPGRAVRILSGLAEIMPGLFRAELQGASRAARGVIEGCLAPGLTDEFYFFIMGTPWSNR